MAEPLIQPYQDDQHDEVADVLTKAYLTNPINMAVFGGTGPEQLRQNRVFFSLAFLEVFSGPRFVAIHEGAIVGFVAWVGSPGCRPSHEQVASFRPRLLAELSPGVAPRLATWLRAWRERDPDAPHNHFGPIAVVPSLQRVGIGRALMQHYCAHLDRSGEPGYLETDRPENVGFYAKSGFKVVDEMELLGVRNWFMNRSAR